MGVRLLTDAEQHRATLPHGYTVTELHININMTYKVVVVLLTITGVFIMRKYWTTRDEKDLCFVTLDKHVKFINELQIENTENKKSNDRLEKAHEEQILTIRKEKINAESRLRLCENLNESKDTDMRKQENLIAEKDEQLEKERGKLESLKNSHENLKSDYDQYVSKYEILKNEKEKALKKVEAQKEEINELESEISQAKKREEKNILKKKDVESDVKKKDVESDVKKKKIKEAADD